MPEEINASRHSEAQSAEESRGFHGQQRRFRFSINKLPKAFTLTAFLLSLSILGIGCNRHKETSDTVTVLIESSPTNLDPRIGVDAQSERIDSLIFDSLVRKDSHFNLQPWLALRWETPDPLTYIFHLRNDVHFQDGRPLTSADVKYTLDTIIEGKVISVKANAYQSIGNIDAPDVRRSSSTSRSLTHRYSGTSAMADSASFPQAADAISGSTPLAAALLHSSAKSRTRT